MVRNSNKRGHSREVTKNLIKVALLLRELADDSEVRRSGARSDRLRAAVGAARPRRAL